MEDDSSNIYNMQVSCNNNDIWLKYKIQIMFDFLNGVLREEYRDWDVLFSIRNLVSFHEQFLFIDA